MTNEQYLDQHGVTGEARDHCLKIMERFGDQHWWLSSDPRERAYYSLKEDVLLVPPDQFQRDVEALLGRPVRWDELGSHRREALSYEAEAAWQGIPYSQEGKEQMMRDSLKASKALKQPQDTLEIGDFTQE